MTNQKTRPIVEFISLTGCGGCLITAASARSFPELADKIEITHFGSASRRAEGVKSVDITFIEGAVASKADIDAIKKARERSKTIVAVGACACTGGLPAYRNFLDITRFTHLLTPSSETSYVQPGPVERHIKVDRQIPGCPPERRDIVRFMMDQMLEKTRIPCRNPVCFECRLNENRCLLEDNRLCLGPITRGGCDSICINGNFECWGCRGASDDPNNEALIRLLDEKGHKKEEIRNRIRAFSGSSIEIHPEQNIRDAILRLKKEAQQASAKEMKKRAVEEKARKKALMIEKKNLTLQKQKEKLEKKKELDRIKKEKQKAKAILIKKLKEKSKEKAKAKALANAKQKAIAAEKKAEKIAKMKLLKEAKHKALKIKQAKLKEMKAKLIAKKKDAVKKAAEAKALAAKKKAIAVKKAAAKKSKQKAKQAPKRSAKAQVKKAGKASAKKSEAKKAPQKKLSFLGKLASLRKKK